MKKRIFIFLTIFILSLFVILLIKVISFFIFSKDLSIIEESSIIKEMTDKKIIIINKKMIGLDLNKNGIIDKGETIVDCNNDNKIELVDVMEFIVKSDIREEDVVKTIIFIIKNNKGEHPDVIRVIKNNYLSKIETKLEVIKEYKKKEVEEIVKKYKEYKDKVEKYNKVIKEGKSKAEIEKIEKEIDTIGFELFKLGYHPLAEEGIFYLPIGIKVKPEKVEYFDNSLKIKKVKLAQNQEIETPAGKVIPWVLSFYESGKVKSVKLARDKEIETPAGKVVAKGGEELSFYESGKVREVYLADKVKINIKGIELPVTYKIIFNEKGNVIQIFSPGYHRETGM